eukprot:scaffold116327_cov37-Prasinocladus_malaysianus.AAC.1
MIIQQTQLGTMTQGFRAKVHCRQRSHNRTIIERARNTYREVFLFGHPRNGVVLNLKPQVAGVLALEEFQ